MLVLYHVRVSGLSLQYVVRLHSWLLALWLPTSCRTWVVLLVTVQPMRASLTTFNALRIILDFVESGTSVLRDVSCTPRSCKFLTVLELAVCKATITARSGVVNTQ